MRPMQRLRPVQFILLCFTVTFGFSLLIQLIVGGEDRGLAGLLIFSAVSGIGMSLFLVVSHMSGIRLRSRKVLSDTFSVRPVAECRIDADCDTVFAQCVEAVASIPGVRSWNADEAQGVITASVGWSWMSWGEAIRVDVQPDAGAVLVRVASKPKLPTTIVDYGRNLRNVETVLRRLDRTFSGGSGGGLQQIAGLHEAAMQQH